MKLSVVSLFGIVLAFSDMAKAGDVNSCAQKIDIAQGCVKVCGETNTSFIDGNSLLQDCNTANLTTLEDCCEMDTYIARSDDPVNCTGSISDASVCLNSNVLARVKEAGADYLQCLFEDGKCLFGGLCLGILTGGYGGSFPNGTVFPNNFAVGTTSNFAAITRNATSCADEGLNMLGKNVCEELGNCCNCTERVAELVNAVTDDLLLPAYGQSKVEKCGGNKTCADYTNYRASARQLDTEDVSLVGPASLNGENTAFAAELALECNDGLNHDVVLHNASHAVSNYLNCLYKKTGKAAAKIEESNQESSGIVLSFAPTAALSAIASAVYAMILA
jgi:hypothetical protein